MGKRQKREKKRHQRLADALDKRLGPVVVTCDCGAKVCIGFIDGWARCDCGQTVTRYKEKK